MHFLALNRASNFPSSNKPTTSSRPSRRQLQNNEIHQDGSEGPGKPRLGQGQARRSCRGALLGPESHRVRVYFRQCRVYLPAIFFFRSSTPFLSNSVVFDSDVSQSACGLWLVCWGLNRTCLILIQSNHGSGSLLYGLWVISPQQWPRFYPCTVSPASRLNSSATHRVLGLLAFLPFIQRTHATPFTSSAEALWLTLHGGSSTMAPTKAAAAATEATTTTNNAADAAGTSLPILNRLCNSPSSTVGSDLRDNSITQSLAWPPPKFLAPPRRVHPKSQFKRQVDKRHEAEMRKVYSSGADQVLAKPPPELNVTVHLSWPAPMRGFKDIDPADVNVKTLLARIASEHDAKVEAEESTSAVNVTVMAMNRARAHEVLSAVRKFYRPGEESLWRARLVVHPPKNGSYCLTALLQPKEGATGRRVTAVTSKNPRPTNQVGLDKTKADYKKALMKMLNEASGHLRHDPTGMQMRVHFGNLVLDEWKKGKTEYDFSELENLMSRAGTRGTAHMLNTVSEAAAKALADRFSHSNMELPETLQSLLKLKREDNGEDGEPTVTYSVVLTTKNLVLESKFERVGTQRFRNGQGVQYSLDPLEVQQLEKQHRAAEFIMVCPESGHDWSVEIHKTAADQATKASPPFGVHQLQKNLSFTGERIGEGFPYFKIPDSFLRVHNIQKLHGKVTLRYGLGFKYTLDITLFYDLEKQKSLPDRATTATVMLHSPDWDYEMSSDASIPRPCKESFEEHFLKPSENDEAPGGQAAGPVDHFLLWVDWIHKGLDGASRGNEQTADETA